MQESDGMCSVGKFTLYKGSSLFTESGMMTRSRTGKLPLKNGSNLNEKRSGLQRDFSKQAKAETSMIKKSVSGGMTLTGKKRSSGPNSLKPKSCKRPKISEFQCESKPASKAKSTYTKV